MRNASMQETQIVIEEVETAGLTSPVSIPYYSIRLFDDATSFSLDLTDYTSHSRCLLFASPHQLFQLKKSSSAKIYHVVFHGDFYCIEYHKKEVACNGVLFNNIYEQPFVSVPIAVYDEILEIYQKMKQVVHSGLIHDNQVLRSYLQLVLALSSREKLLAMDISARQPIHEIVVSFQSLIETYFRERKEVIFYASETGLSVDAFSKKIKKHFGKTPSKLIQERLVLEAKKLLHLTYKPVKEIAAELGFQDEFYFSRYFKREVGVSPGKYRSEVGISVAAK